MHRTVLIAVATALVAAGLAAPLAVHADGGQAPALPLLPAVAPVVAPVVAPITGPSVAGSGSPSSPPSVVTNVARALPVSAPALAPALPAPVQAVTAPVQAVLAPVQPAPVSIPAALAPVTAIAAPAVSGADETAAAVSRAVPDAVRPPSPQTAPITSPLQPAASMRPAIAPPAAVASVPPLGSAGRSAASASIAPASSAATIAPAPSAAIEPAPHTSAAAPAQPELPAAGVEPSQASTVRSIAGASSPGAAPAGMAARLLQAPTLQIDSAVRAVADWATASGDVNRAAPASTSPLASLEITAGQAALQPVPAPLFAAAPLVTAPVIQMAPPRSAEPTAQTATLPSLTPAAPEESSLPAPLHRAPVAAPASAVGDSAPLSTGTGGGAPFAAQTTLLLVLGLLLVLAARRLYDAAPPASPAYAPIAPPG